MMATASIEPAEYECPVCNDYFKKPKLLLCGHVLCRDCLLSWLQSNKEALCPLCRCSMINAQVKAENNLGDMVDMLPDDVAMEALVESAKIINTNRVCFLHADKAAVAVCLQCRESYCQNCSEPHKKSSATCHHHVEDLSTLTAEKLAANHHAVCTTHGDKTAELFCSTHHVPICHVCALLEHRDCYDLLDLKKRADVARGQLEQLLASLTSAELSLKESTSKLDQIESNLEKNTQTVIHSLEETQNRLQCLAKVCNQHIAEVCKSNSENMNKIRIAKDDLLKRHGKAVSHKLVVKRVQQTISGSELFDITTKLKACIGDLVLDASLPADLESFTVPGFTFDMKVLASLEDDLSHFGSLRASVTKQINWIPHKKENIPTTNDWIHKMSEPVQVQGKIMPKSDVGYCKSASAPLPTGLTPPPEQISSAPLPTGLTPPPQQISDYYNLPQHTYQPYADTSNKAMAPGRMPAPGIGLGQQTQFMRQQSPQYYNMEPSQDQVWGPPNQTYYVQQSTIRPRMTGNGGSGNTVYINTMPYQMPPTASYTTPQVQFIPQPSQFMPNLDETNLQLGPGGSGQKFSQWVRSSQGDASRSQEQDKLPTNRLQPTVSGSSNPSSRNASRDNSHNRERPETIRSADGPDALNMSSDQDLQWLESDAEAPLSPPPMSSHPTGWVADKLTDTLREKKTDNEKILDWIESNVSEEETLEEEQKSKSFMRDLMTAICHSAISGTTGNAKLLPEMITTRRAILLKYLENCPELELQALYALQALVNKLEHPPGLLRSFFDTLYDEEIISEETFTTWEETDEQSEGKAIALLGTQNFFVWLCQDEKDSWLPY